MILGACTQLSEWGALFARVAQLFKWRMLPACDTPAITWYGKLEAYPTLKK